jgi:hypothetical protein
MSERLPTVTIPVTTPDQDVLLDLQLALDTAYDVIGFQHAIDHDAPPSTPLSPEDAAWAAQVLRIRDRRSDL